MAGAPQQTLPCNMCALGRATRPVGTPCGHTFCWSCLHQHFLDHHHPAPCPRCGIMLMCNKFYVIALFVSELPRQVEGSESRPRAPTEEDSRLRPARRDIPSKHIKHEMWSSEDEVPQDPNLIGTFGSWDTACVQWGKRQKRRLHTTKTRHSGRSRRRSSVPTGTVWVELDQEGRFNWGPAPVRM